MTELPGSGDKPNRSRSLEDLTQGSSQDREDTPVQLNVRVPAYLRKALQHRKVETGKTIEEMVTEALSNYLDR